MKILGIIPARGGSKGVPRKNIKLLAGKPLIQYTIEAAQASSLSRVVLSSEDPEILAVARRLGCEALQRPEQHAADTSPMIPVIQHALATCEQDGGETYEAVFILQPTTPFRTADDIDASVDLLLESSAESVIGVVRVYDQHPARIKKIDQNRLQPFCVPEVEGTRRQDLEPAYLRNGAIYLVRRAAIKAGSVMGRDQCPMEMPAERSVNIDEPMDFLLAEAVLARGLDE